ncbi:MAG: rRNA maturation RNase YbeY [Alphaproteobacteria bacterium]|nr:rRNA maturation RNase YbeY [Alphaproteobacteria bacterium]
MTDVYSSDDIDPLSRKRGFFALDLILELETDIDVVACADAALAAMDGYFGSEIFYAATLKIVDDETIQGANAEFRHKDKPTNVLSFPDGTDDGEALYLGDIMMSLDTVMREAKEQVKPVEEHIVHLMIHGFLHLMGYDHEEESEAVEMETLEIELLQTLDIKNPYEEKGIPRD